MVWPVRLQLGFVQTSWLRWRFLVNLLVTAWSAEVEVCGLMGRSLLILAQCVIS
jgi:hypothetical protein